MARLIDAKFAQHIANVELQPDTAGAVQWVLSHTPTVDAVEVVRCKDCKHWCFETGLCNLHSNFSKSVLHFFDEYDFCSYGERKEGAD